MSVTRLVAFAVSLLSLAACLPSSVESVTLTPESPEVEAVLRAADARWEAAGVAADRVQIGPGGSPVRLVPSRGNTAQTSVRGQGSAYMGVRWVELQSLDLDLATHELGHVLGINVVALDGADHIDAAECGAAQHARPLMCEVVGGTITATDLDLACSVGRCDWFTPEG
jgi:hypothetical protein